MTPENIGHFKIEGKLGAGGMGEVYLANDTSLQRQVAIKLLPEDLCQDESLRQRFLQEARAASALNHPNVCTIHEVGETDDGQPYICMEYIDGESLEDVISDTNTLSYERIGEIARQIVAALCGAYESQIVHRDLKPGNICINSQGVLKILDFGLAKKMGLSAPADGATVDLNLTSEGRILGTPNYMSPEQALATDVDHRSDIFSTGVILYEMVTGKRPFLGESIGQVINNIINQPLTPASRLAPGMPAELDRIIAKCLEKKAEHRYQTPDDLKTDLENLEQGRPVDAGNMTATASGINWTPEIAGSSNESDVYITYSALDDHAMSASDEGWISRFHRNLKVRLQQLAGREVHVYRPPKYEADDKVTDEVLNDIPTAKSLLTIISPPFAKSENCQKEVSSFVEGKSANDTNIIKVVKTPVADEQLREFPEPLSNTNNHEFFEEDSESGRVLEFEESFGEDLKRRYYEKIYDVAHDINQTLDKSLDDTSDSQIGRGKAYVSVTTSDVRNEYESTCRELTAQGFRIVPDKPLALEKTELENEVNSYLEDCELVVQIIGGNYGTVPENSLNSALELQSLQISKWIESNEAYQFVWVNNELTPTDDRQSAFLNRIRSEDANSVKCDLIEGHVSLLKEALSQHLADDPEDDEPERSGSDIKQIYLVCDSSDEEATASLEDYLFEQGFEVSTSDFGLPPDEIIELHRDNLVFCDAVLIYYGGVRKSWVDIKLRDTIKAAGYGRSEPISHTAVFIAPPHDNRKERFKSHMATTIKQSGESFEPSDELEAFLNQINSQE